VLATHRGALPRLRGRGEQGDFACLTSLISPRPSRRTKGEMLSYKRCGPFLTKMSQELVERTSRKYVLIAVVVTYINSVMYTESRKHPTRQPTVSVGNLSVILLITACTYRRRGILAREEIHRLLRDAWIQAPEWAVGHYAVMPDHVHLFAAENEFQGYPLGQWVAKWKAYVSRRWPLNEEKPVWQRNFWDRQLRNGDSYGAKWMYVRNNPVRHGLVLNSDDWPFQGMLNQLSWHDR
jgi:putative transposase